MIAIALEVFLGLCCFALLGNVLRHLHFTMWTKVLGTDEQLQKLKRVYMCSRLTYMSVLLYYYVVVWVEILSLSPDLRLPVWGFQKVGLLLGFQKVRTFNTLVLFPVLCVAFLLCTLNACRLRRRIADTKLKPEFAGFVRGLMTPLGSLWSGGKNRAG